MAVALALVAQRSPLGEVFFAVALTVLPAVLFLGLVTFVRVLQSSVEDILGLLAGVTVALAVVMCARPPLPVTVLAGIVSGTTVLAVHLAYQVRRFAAMEATVAAAFPTPGRRPTLVP
jgi:hypothetical protein